MTGKRFGLSWQEKAQKVNNQKKSPHEAGNSPELRGNDSGKTKRELNYEPKANAMQEDCRVYPLKRIHHIFRSGKIFEYHAVMFSDYRIGKQGLCFQQTALQGWQL